MFRLVALLCCACLLGADTPKGTLVIVGGGGMPQPILDAFLQASGGKGGTVGIIPTSRKANPHKPPNDFNPAVRRWSSQAMAGRRGRPCASTLISVERWVVSATPAIAALETPGICQSCWQAPATDCQKTSGSSSAQPGCSAR